jgi:hypothetical protein
MTNNGDSNFKVLWNKSLPNPVNGLEMILDLVPYWLKQSGLYVNDSKNKPVLVPQECSSHNFHTAFWRLNRVKNINVPVVLFLYTEKHSQYNTFVTHGRIGQAYCIRWTMKQMTTSVLKFACLLFT